MNYNLIFSTRNKKGIVLYIIFYILSSLNTTAKTPDIQQNNLIKVRIKDITRINGIHNIQLLGYGLVVGLNGTGDSAAASFTIHSVKNMLSRFEIDTPDIRGNLKNVAAVMVTAELPALAKMGGRIDVLVSSLGDAKSISGGTLLPAPIYSPDGQLYAIAQGSISSGGFNVVVDRGNSSQKNQSTVGRVPNGAAIQQSPPFPSFLVTNNENPLRSFTIVLDEPDFSTAIRLASAINADFTNEKSPIANAIDASSIKITIPELESDIIAFISRLENLMVEPDVQAVVVIDERNGTIVAGKDVRISPVAISHGSLTIQIKTDEEVSQPPALSSGETAIISKKAIEVKEENRRMKVIRGGASIDEVVKALNLLGVTPRDMIIILQAIKASGALHAKLIIM